MQQHDCIPRTQAGSMKLRRDARRRGFQTRKSQRAVGSARVVEDSRTISAHRDALAEQVGDVHKGLAKRL